MYKTSIILLGATGYIGGSVLSRLLSHPSKDTFEITTLVRSEEKAKKLESFSVKTVIGSYEDTALVERLAEDAHVVFSCADADAFDATNALLAGLKNGHARWGYLPILIHTSGTGLLTYDGSTKGGHDPDKIYYDDDPDDIENSFPPAALHRNVDLAIVQADKDDTLRTGPYHPSQCCLGIARNPLVDAGISGRHSKQIPASSTLLWLAARQAWSRKARLLAQRQHRRAYVQTNSHYNPCSVRRLFIVLYDAIVNNPDKVGHGRDASILERMASIAVLWLARKNSRGRGRHSRSLGWQPKMGTQDMLASIEAEVDVIVKQKNMYKGGQAGLLPFNLGIHTTYCMREDKGISIGRHELSSMISSCWL
ncbi:hypothetical protein BC629DRAFT_1440597 [Irpex lacteus]|nr:hypothetical protein BC629DRAFT_1440597 [Irpex lacteus]